MTAAIAGFAGNAQAETTIDSLHPHAWGANIGWVNARPDEASGSLIGQSYCLGHLWSANCGWIALGSGSPANGWRYANDSNADWGVNHDGEGRLTGYAWGASIGWIAFEQTFGQPRVDLRTGDLSGYAWGANIGWISLSNTAAHVRTERLAAGPDTDADGIADAYEWRQAGNLATLKGGAHDADGDGTPDASEAVADTDPLDHSDLLRITACLPGTTEDTLTWRSRPTRLYQIETSTNLPAGSWTDAADGLIGPPAGKYATHAIEKDDATTRFHRIRAIVPLSE